jgi:anti-sigma factor RsiW
MAHLGDRVAAVVDDALDEAEWSRVQAHLMTCEHCREAVRRERHLKSSMVCGPAPRPPADLVRALADRAALAEHVARQERRRLAAVHAAVTVGGLCASLTVLGLCAGGSSPLQARQAPARVQPPVAAVTSTAATAVSRGVRTGATADPGVVSEVVAPGRAVPAAWNRR